MTRRVYLHVGAPKSGTTYLQRVLRHNQDSLARQGVLVAGRTHTELVHAGFVVRKDRRLARLPPEASQAWQRLVSDIRDFRGDTAVISYELLAGARPVQARRAIESLAGMEVHVVVTCRDLGRSVASAWQERLKFGLTTRLEDWRPRPATHGPRAEWGWRTMDPAVVASRWGGTLPPAQVHIVTLPRASSSPRELWQRFAEACSFGMLELDLDVPTVNESLGARAAEVLRRVNEHDLGPIDGAREQSRWLRDVLAHTVLAGLDREPTSITDAQLRVARRRATKAVEQISSSGWSVHGDLDDVAATRREGRLPGGVPAEELLEIAVQSIVSLLLELRAETLSTSAEPDGPRSLGARASGRLRAVAAAARGEAPARIEQLTRRLQVLERQIHQDRALHERLAALSDVVTELLLPASHRDDAAVKKALRSYRKASL